MGFIDKDQYFRAFYSEKKQGRCKKDREIIE